MSFMATLPQMTMWQEYLATKLPPHIVIKTVTRRLGWWFLQSGDLLNVANRCMGFKKGEKMTKYGQIVVLSSQKKRLKAMTQEECQKEGFPGMNPTQFIQMFCAMHRTKHCNPSTAVNRVEFRHILMLVIWGLYLELGENEETLIQLTRGTLITPYTGDIRTIETEDKMLVRRLKGRYYAYFRREDPIYYLLREVMEP
jgi:hypothetical protein